MKSLSPTFPGTQPLPEHLAAGGVPHVIAATAQSLPNQADALLRARAFAEPLLASTTMPTGENTLAHADAVANILRGLGGSPAMQAAIYLVFAGEHLARPRETIAKAFGDSFADVAVETNQLIRLQRMALRGNGSSHTENLRKMLLAFSRDLRVIMLRLASRVQTLRWFVESKQTMPEQMARETLEVLAPLANRLGIWQIKWEMEDLAFRFLEPDFYKQIAKSLDETRIEREGFVEMLSLHIEQMLNAEGIPAKVQGRPKHIYSIAKKMRGKGLDFARVFDIRALRVIVDTVPQCYAALSHVHDHYTPITEEFDDYIARPKPNGYQSLHTVVRDDEGRAIEIQIRTQAMHDHAESGVAAHWAYKEAGAKGYAGVSASSAYDAKLAVLRQLLAWQRDLSGTVSDQGLMNDHIYVLTPDAAVVELPRGATPIDFAYTVHTSLGHRCRGAKVDGAMVPLSTALQNGQTVEITAAKEGGPSRDWLNPDQGYIVSNRARAKVRAFFNAQITQAHIARGREAVERLLQREGKTAIKLDDLADQLGFKTADDLFEVVGKDEFSLRNIEQLLNPPEPAPSDDEALLLKKNKPTAPSNASGGVLVVGMDSLLTQLARCCKPAPPDEIRGFVTRGRGVSIHRHNCANFKAMASRDGGRVIDVTWGKPTRTTDGKGAAYSVDVSVEAVDRQGLLRDISEVFAKEKTNVISVQTQSVKGMAYMTFTVQVNETSQLPSVLSQVGSVAGVRSAKRR